MIAFVLALIVSQGQPYGEPQTIYKPQDRQLSVFGHHKVVQEYPVWSLSFQYGLNGDKVVTSVDGGTAVAEVPEAVLRTPSDGGVGFAQLQSKEAIRYVPGQGVRARFTVRYSPCALGGRQEAGIGDLVDGFFFGCANGVFAIIHRSNNVETVYPQTAWNGARYPSDPTKGNVYEIAYQWLGYGVVRFYAETPQGESALVHQIDYPNTAIYPSLSNPMLRAWYLVNRNTPGAMLTMAFPSFGAVAEGPPEDHGVVNGASHRKTISSTPTNVMSLRNKATFNGLSNRIRIRLLSIYLSASGTSDVTCTARIGATLAGTPNFVDNHANSIAAIDTAGTTVSDGRTRYALIFEAGGGGAQTQVPSLELYIEPGETLTIACASQTGSPATNVALNWSEEFAG